MKKSKNTSWKILVCIIMSLVGILSTAVYFATKTEKDINSIPMERIHVPEIWYVVVPLILVGAGFSIYALSKKLK